MLSQKPIFYHTFIKWYFIKWCITILLFVPFNIEEINKNYGFLLRLSVNKYITIITTDFNKKYTTYNSHETKCFFIYIYNNRTVDCLFVRCKIQGKSETLECLVAGGTLTAQLINHLDAAGSIGHTCSPSTCIEVIIFFSFSFISP